jgi:hypothetical protein
VTLGCLYEALRTGQIGGGDEQEEGQEEGQEGQEEEQEEVGRLIDGAPAGQA